MDTGSMPALEPCRRSSIRGGARDRVRNGSLLSYRFLYTLRASKVATSARPSPGVFISRPGHAPGFAFQAAGMSDQPSLEFQLGALTARITQMEARQKDWE